jgi:type IV pilus secretin PilQ/predicted competence protein
MNTLHAHSHSIRRTLLASGIACALLTVAAQAGELRDAQWIGNALQLQLDQPAQAQLYVDPRQPRLILDLAETSIGEPQQFSETLRGHPAVVDAQVLGDSSRSRIVLDLNQTQSAKLENNGAQITLQLHALNATTQAPVVNDAPSVLAHRLTQPNSPDYRGTPLTLNFQQIETRRALEILAEFTGLNIITSDAVQGNVTLRLHQVPWDQALDVILQAQGLAMRGQGNVLWIAPANELASINEVTQSAARAAPLVHTQIPVHYAQASELAKLLEGAQSHLLSPRGSLRVDERTNTLLIRDTEAQLEDIRTALQELDRPAQQVLIESRIVIASDDFTKDLGVKLGLEHVPGDQDGWEVGVSGTISDSRTALLQGSPNGATNLAVNLPGNSAVTQFGSLGISLGKLPLGTLIGLELRAAQLQGLSETIANPRILTSNGKEALIQQGVEIPYKSDTSSGATDVEFKEAVMELKVTPRVTPNGQIILTVSVKKDSPTVDTYGDYSEPGINTNEIQTEVMIADGETLVIGGIYEQVATKNQNKVPFLGDIPFVGRLFRNDYNSNQKDELLVFLTPQILKEGAAPSSQRYLQMPAEDRPDARNTADTKPQS